MADDQGWNGTSVKMMHNEPGSKSDYFETPNLEQLAKRGIRFSNAYASAPVCAPSRYSIQFGKSPARLSLIRVGMNTDHIDHEGFISIPKALKKINNKYKTAHFGKWGMGSNPYVPLAMMKVMDQPKIRMGILSTIKANGKMNLRKIRKIFFRLLIKQLNSLHQV